MRLHPAVNHDASSLYLALMPAVPEFRGGVEIHQKDAAMLVRPLRGEHDGLRLVLQEGSVAYRLIWVGIGECLVLVGGEGREEYSLI